MMIRLPRNYYSLIIIIVNCIVDRTSTSVTKSRPKLRVEGVDNPHEIQIEEFEDEGCTKDFDTVSPIAVSHPHTRKKNSKDEADDAVDEPNAAFVCISLYNSDGKINMYFLKQSITKVPLIYLITY
jgi:CRISPR/Cas system endoribonuclease Cas6 (RAMP superfamily)